MTDEAPSLPSGEYAIVEVMGHRTYVGRITEVERFGSKLMSIEPLFRGQLQEAVLISGQSIYQFTPCSAEVALARAPKEDWQLPAPVRATLPPLALQAPDDDAFDGIDPDFVPDFLKDDDD